jgi:hypothetical protein
VGGFGAHRLGVAENAASAPSTLRQDPRKKALTRPSLSPPHGAKQQLAVWKPESRSPTKAHRLRNRLAPRSTLHDLSFEKASAGSGAHSPNPADV